MNQEFKTIDKFDRMMGALVDLPDVTKVKPSTVICTSPMIGASQSFIVQTFRQREVGDTVFIQYIDDAGSVRMVIPPAAAEAIARQRDGPQHQEPPPSQQRDRPGPEGTGRVAGVHEGEGQGTQR